MEYREPFDTFYHKVIKHRPESRFDVCESMRKSARCHFQDMQRESPSGCDHCRDHPLIRMSFTNLVMHTPRQTNCASGSAGVNCHLISAVSMFSMTIPWANRK